MTMLPLLTILLGIAVAIDERIVVGGDGAEPRIRRGSVVSELCFAADLESECVVRVRSIVMAPGGRIVFEKGAHVGNQTIEAELELRGDVTLANDNSWTHNAHMLRFTGILRGAGVVTIDGASDGGVQLAGDSSRSFSGPARVVGGNLIAAHLGALGSTDVGTTLLGGRLTIPGGRIDEPLFFEGDAGVHLGSTATLGGDVFVAAGKTASIDTGGGNQGTLLGKLTGEGQVQLRGGGRNPQLELSPFVLDGDAPNSLTGRVTVRRGTLLLSKPDGVPAIVGELVLGGGSNRAVVRLGASEQIVDEVPLAFTGEQPVMLWTDGHSETLGPLLLKTEAVIRFGEGPDLVRFAASNEQGWSGDGELIVEGWSGAKRGGGEDQLSFGSSKSGLARTQVAAIGFRDPGGFSPGLYAARVASRGELVPSQRIKPNPANAFAVDERADEKRAALYRSDGRAKLCGPDTPLEAGATIAFFGDSITWQHGYLGFLEGALSAGEGTRALGVRVINRGINGGGVRDLRDGFPRSAQAGGRPGVDGNAPQAPFVELLATDRPTAVVIFIGINDVNFKGTSEEEFERVLGELTHAAQAAGARVVLATLLLGGELPDGSNPDDPAIATMAEATRRVAAETGATLVDLRRAAIAWLRNHNRRLHLDGSLQFERVGLLTYDGIHPSAVGNELIADLLGEGLCRALGR